jgi:hypothetical protein
MYDNCEINTFTLMGLYYSELKYIYSIGLCLKNTNLVENLKEINYRFHTLS